MVHTVPGLQTVRLAHIGFFAYRHTVLFLHTGLALHTEHSVPAPRLRGPARKGAAFARSHGPQLAPRGSQRRVPAAAWAVQPSPGTGGPGTAQGGAQEARARARSRWNKGHGKLGRGQKDPCKHHWPLACACMVKVCERHPHAASPKMPVGTKKTLNSSKIIIV